MTGHLGYKTIYPYGYDPFVADPSGQSEKARRPGLRFVRIVVPIVILILAFGLVALRVVISGAMTFVGTSHADGRSNVWANEAQLNYVRLPGDRERRTTSGPDGMVRDLTGSDTWSLSRLTPDGRFELAIAVQHWTADLSKPRKRTLWEAERAHDADDLADGYVPIDWTLLDGHLAMVSRFTSSESYTYTTTYRVSGVHDSLEIECTSEDSNALIECENLAERVMIPGKLK